MCYKEYLAEIVDWIETFFDYKEDYIDPENRCTEEFVIGSIEWLLEECVFFSEEEVRRDILQKKGIIISNKLLGIK